MSEPCNAASLKHLFFSAVVIAVCLAAPASAVAASPGSNGAIAFTVGNDFPAQEKNIVEIDPAGTGRTQVNDRAAFLSRRCQS